MVFDLVTVSILRSHFKLGRVRLQRETLVVVSDKQSLARGVHLYRHHFHLEVRMVKGHMPG